MRYFCQTLISHFELFHVGQARLARYPIHFHFDEDFNYRADKYGEILPQAGFLAIFVFICSKYTKMKTNISQLIVFPSIMQIVDF